MTDTGTSVRYIFSQVQFPVTICPAFSQVQKSETEWLLVFENKIQTEKGSKECLFIMTQAHKMQIFWEIPFQSHKTALKQQINC